MRNLCKITAFLITLIAFGVAPLCAKDTQPSPIIRVQPVYPPDLARKGITGEVFVDFIVDTQGNVAEAVVSPESENAPWQFRYSAIVAVWQWKFKPGLKDGVAVNTRVKVPLTFHLKQN
jgi:periplasmic protein TonB